MMENPSDGGYPRPRRPNPETVTYLGGLPLDEDLAARKAREYSEQFQGKSGGGVTNVDGEDEDQLEYPQALAAAHAAVSSIFHEFASLACEEVPSQKIETLVRISCRYSLLAKRVVLAGLGGYWVFLSTHRFGSHVAQTALRCAVAECEANLDDLDDGRGGESEGRMVVDDSYGGLLENEDGVGGRSLSELLLRTLEELRPFASELSVHVCGTHVIRTALCILARAEFVEAFPRSRPETGSGVACSEWDTGVLAATRRGKLKDKKKKKKKKRESSTAEDGCSSIQVATVVREMKVVQELQSEDLKKDAEALLNEMVCILSLSDGEGGDEVRPPGELQRQICHPSAGPLLVQMVRLFSFRGFHPQPHSRKKGSKKEVMPDRRLGVLPPEPTYGRGSRTESLVHRLLCWDPSITKDGGDDSGGDEGTGTKQPYAGDVIYGLSGEPRGSILLEAVFRCCPDPFHNSLCVAGGFYDGATLRDYIQDGVSNFVVQTLLTSVRHRDQVSRMIDCLCGIVEDGSLLKGATTRPDDGRDGRGRAENGKAGTGSHRMGIIWRAFEMCANKGSSHDQERILSALLRGFALMTASQENHGENTTKKKRKKRSTSKGLSVEECIPRLLGLAPGSCEGEGEYSKDGSLLTLDAVGARVLYHIFQFKERLRKDWVTSILDVYGGDDLTKIANDGLGSRCVIDGLLDGPARSIASKLLVPKLSDRVLFLATERVGHHTVEKLFRALPTTDDQAAFSADLSRSLNRLGSNAMGRSVMVTCAVKEYLEGENVWKAALQKQRGKDRWLEEILGEKDCSGEEAYAGPKTGEEANAEPKAKKHKKHKKEKKRKPKTNTKLIT